MRKKGGDLVNFKANRCILTIIAYINKIRRKIGKIEIIGVVLGLLIAFCVYNMYNIKASSYLIKVNDKKIGYVKSIKEAKSIINSIKSSDADAAKAVTYIKTNNNKNIMNAEDVQKAVRYALNLKVNAVSICANGIEVAKLYDKNEAQQVIQKIKEYYYPKITNGTYEILSSNIKEQITFSDVLVKPSEILSVNDAVKNIVSGRGLEKTYTIKEKDTIWDIAIKNNMTVEELRQLNPNINIDKIKIGQVIKLSVNEPYVNVEIVAKIKDREEIPYESKKVEDKTLSKGTKKVKQLGRNGIADVEKVVTLLNDDTMDEDITKITVIEKAVDEIIAYGSKTSMYAATGRFIMPSRGVITSRYGYRWGRMHEGVDIAAPRGTAIVAADSGKVCFSGWRSGYGYCVMINHGNGYQTLYGHASKLYVKTGEYVKKGEKIAAVGSTGRSTGPHLHFEVRVNGSSKNPLKYIK